MKTTASVPGSKLISHWTSSQSHCRLLWKEGIFSYTNRSFFWVPELTRAHTSSLRASASLAHTHGSHSSLRCAVLGAGFAGLSVAWHLLHHSTKDLQIEVDIFDEVGIGGGASGVSGGLLHPYSPKVKPLWKAEECWRECMNLLGIAEEAAHHGSSSNDYDLLQSQNATDYIVRRRGILRPAMIKKNLDVMHENAQKSLASCRVETIDGHTSHDLIPNLCTPLNSAFFMPKAVNINPQRYLKALFLACQNLVARKSESGLKGTRFCLHKQLITAVSELDGMFDIVVICLGARVDMLTELSGQLPLRTCRGIVAHLQLPDDVGEEYREDSPSILADAWMAIQGPRSLHLGSTWDWGSRNFSLEVSSGEAFSALEELLPKAKVVYPLIERWRLEGVRAGLRAMPPHTSHGSLPLLGCINDFVGKRSSHCGYWLIGGLGSRGLLYHGWVGKLTAQAIISGNEYSLPSELTLWKDNGISRD